jgi:hypothetical protein
MTDETEKPKINGTTSPIVVQLRKPVIANGDEVNELAFREPTAADIERVGNPVNVDMLSGDVPKLSFDAKSMTQMMALLAAVPPSTIRQMNTRDWNSAAWQLASFFMPDL